MNSAAGYTVTRHRGGKTELRVFRPHDATGGLAPLLTWSRDARSGTAAVMLGRLFYRDDILPRIPAQSGRYASDAAIALAAYQHAGAEGLVWLEGEFALAIWDAPAGQMVLLRDPCGAWPLFWLDMGEWLVVTTSLARLTDLLPSRPFDPHFMAEFLMRPSAVEELPSERTAYEGVRRVLPGTLVTLGRSGSISNVQTCDWTAPDESAGGLTLEEAGQRFVHLFRRAVQVRMEGGPVAAHLSGGMDSSAVVRVAAEWVQAGGSPVPLRTLSLVYRRRGLAGERAWIDRVVDLGGPIEAHMIEADDAVAFRWFDQPLPPHDEPVDGLRGLAIARLLVDAAQRLGASIILTGLYSDELLDVGAFYIADLLRARQWVAALREATVWAHARSQGRWSVLRRYGFEPLWPRLMRDGLRPWFHRGAGAWPTLGRFTVPPWVRPSFARRHRMRELGTEHARWAGRARFTGWSPALTAVYSGVGDWVKWALAAPRGIQISHPFLDPRLIRFCLGLPVPFKANPARRKPVLQEAMKHLLPGPTLARREKRGFDDVYGSGLSRSLPQLEEMVESSAIHDLGLFDESKLIAVMRQAAVGIGDSTARERMNKSLALIAWFDQAAGRRSATSPVEVHSWCGPGEGRRTGPEVPSPVL